ncbi:helix-turn-helix domain-containing protein [Marimonas sp. MJW-29]|uniref:Helix-turn-helix domain-containing protein n=1 Tax=Sulfitobacter sediminis TaxID=3234186 RepID=A0ABV3RTM0_9RHOB
MIRELRRRLGMTQQQLAEQLHVDQGTVSRWERGVESPRPRRWAALNDLLLRDESRRAMLRSLAFLRQDYFPTSLLDSKLKLVEISAKGKKHFLDRGLDPDAMIGRSLDAYASRFGNPAIEEQLKITLEHSGLLSGEALLYRFVRNYNGRGHTTIYEPIFENGQLWGVLNYVARYFNLPQNGYNGFELIEAVRTDDVSKAVTLLRGPNFMHVQSALRIEA